MPGTTLAESLRSKAVTISWEFREVYTESQRVGINANKPVQTHQTLKCAGTERQRVKEDFTKF